MTITTVFCLTLLVLIAMIDARTGMIPDFLSVPFLFFSLLRGYVLGTSMIFPAIIGGGFFAAQWLLSRGKWVGSGDVILAAGIGAFLGSISLLLIALGTAYGVGAVVSVILLASGRKSIAEKIPMGPFLVTGTIVAMVSVYIRY